MTDLAATAILIAACVAWFVLQLSRFQDFVIDDAFISLRYADRLLEGAGLTWNDGERVEGYSNLLWVLSLALLGRLGFDLVDAMAALGVGCSALAIAFTSIYFRPHRGWPQLVVAASAGLALASSGPLLVQTAGGLEQPMLAALLAMAAWAMSRVADRGSAPPAASLVILGIPLGLLCLVRPDGPIFAVALAPALAWPHGARGLSPVLKTGGLVLLVPAALYLGQLAFRLWYYGAWVPNTAHVKVGLEAGSGFYYTWSGLRASGGLLLLSFLAFPAALAGPPPLRRRLVALALPLAAWTAYVVAIGGDVFEGRRHLVPTLIFITLLAGEGGLYLLQRGVMQRRRTWVVLGLLVAVGLPLGSLQSQADPAVRSAEHSRARLELKHAAEVLLEAFPEGSPLIALKAAGSIPYRTRWPTIDRLGLNDPHIARNPARPPTKGPIGHRHHDDDYVLAGEPDLLMFGGWLGALHPKGVGDRGLLEDPEFLEAYHPAVLTAPSAPRSWPVSIWVRRDSPVVGVKREDGVITVPVHLVGEGPVQVGGGTWVEVPGGQALELNLPPLPSGEWGLEAIASPVVEVECRLLGTEAPSSPCMFATSGTAPVTLALTPTADTALAGIRLVPASDGR